MITERTLKKWRREALETKERIGSPINGGDESKLEWAERILRMTQELLDKHLLRRPSR